MTDTEKDIRCRIRDKELDEFFDGRDTDGRQPWQSEEWQEKREQVLGEQCEWCGSEEELAVHHEEHQGVKWWKVWDKIRDELFERSKYYEEIEEPTVECCPECGKRSFYSRETKSPTYRCQNCTHTFENPEQKPVSKRSSDEYWRKMDQFVEEAAEIITEGFERAYDDYWDSYFDLEDTVTICKSCHYAYHENDQKICSNCEESYGDYRRKLGRYLCWDCLVEVKGLEKCSECGENWYNPEYRDSCKSCANTLDFGSDLVTWVCVECGELWENSSRHELPYLPSDEDCNHDVYIEDSTYFECEACEGRWGSKADAQQHHNHTNCEGGTIIEEVAGER